MLKIKVRRFSTRAYCSNFDCRPKKSNWNYRLSEFAGSSPIICSNRVLVMGQHSMSTTISSTNHLNYIAANHSFSVLRACSLSLFLPWLWAACHHTTLSWNRCNAFVITYLLTKLLACAYLCLNHKRVRMLRFFLTLHIQNMYVIRSRCSRHYFQVKISLIHFFSIHFCVPIVCQPNHHHWNGCSGAIVITS